MRKKARGEREKGGMREIGERGKKEKKGKGREKGKENFLLLIKILKDFYLSAP